MPNEDAKPLAVVPCHFGFDGGSDPRTGDGLLATRKRPYPRGLFGMLGILGDLDMMLELSDEQRRVLETAVDEQISAIDRRVREKRERLPQYSPQDLFRHRTILEQLLADLRYPL